MGASVKEYGQLLAIQLLHACNYVSLKYIVSRYIIDRSFILPDIFCILQTSYHAVKTVCNSSKAMKLCFSSAPAFILLPHYIGHFYCTCAVTFNITALCSNLCSVKC